MVSKLFSGKEILAKVGKQKKNAKITRSQTGSQAKKALIKKYGEVEDSTVKQYYHRGNGYWCKWDKGLDVSRERDENKRIVFNSHGNEVEKTKSSGRKFKPAAKKHMGDARAGTAVHRGKKITGRL